MIFEKTNLQERLKRLREKEVNEAVLLEKIKKILHQEEEDDQTIRNRVLNSEPLKKEQNSFDFDLLESDRIFHLSQIKRLCIQYRLRFLNTKYFKGDLPCEAFTAVKALENKHQSRFGNFSMLAPASYFKLENADDPMLFAPLGNDYFYLVHKWGNDLHPLRKLMVWPLQNLETLIIFSFFTSFLLTFGIRELFFSSYQAPSEFMILFLYTFKSVLAILFFYGFSLGKNFSSGNWNSKFYNA